MSPRQGNIRRFPNGIAFRLRLTPKSGTDRVEGWIPGPEGALLKARVSAPPEKGKANASVIALLADCLRIPKSAITIASGETGRVKTIEIHGDAEMLVQRLEALGEAP